MKTIKQLREEYCKLFEQEEVEDKRLTTLVRAGLFDMKKLPILKRALQKDSRAMTPAEKNILISLLDSVLHQVTSSSQIYNRVKQNVTVTEATDYLNTIDPRVKTPSSTNIPTVLVLRRKAVRRYPDNQTVALYYAPSIDKYVSIPFDNYITAIGAVNEEEKKSGFKTGGEIPASGFKTGGEISSSGFRTGGYLEDKPESPKTTAPERTSEPTSKPSDGLDNWRKETEHYKRVDAMMDRLRKKDTSNDPNYRRPTPINRHLDRLPDINDLPERQRKGMQKHIDAANSKIREIERAGKRKPLPYTDINYDTDRKSSTPSQNDTIKKRVSQAFNTFKTKNGYRTGGTIPPSSFRTGGKIHGRFHKTGGKLQSKFRTGGTIPASGFRTGGTMEEGAVNAYTYKPLPAKQKTAPVKSPTQASKQPNIANRVSNAFDAAEKAKPAPTPVAKPATPAREPVNPVRPAAVTTPVPRPPVTAKPVTPAREPANPVRPVTAKPAAQTSTPAREPVNPDQPKAQVAAQTTKPQQAQSEVIRNRVNTAHNTAYRAPKPAPTTLDKTRNTMAQLTRAGETDDERENRQSVTRQRIANAPQRIRTGPGTISGPELASPKTPDEYVVDKDESPSRRALARYREQQIQALIPSYQRTGKGPDGKEIHPAILKNIKNRAIKPGATTNRPETQWDRFNKDMKDAFGASPREVISSMQRSVADGEQREKNKANEPVPSTVKPRAKPQAQGPVLPKNTRSMEVRDQTKTDFDTRNKQADQDRASEKDADKRSKKAVKDAAPYVGTIAGLGLALPWALRLLGGAGALGAGGSGKNKINNTPPDINTNATIHKHTPGTHTKGLDVLAKRREMRIRQKEADNHAKDLARAEKDAMKEETINLGGNRITINTNIKNKLVEVYDNLSEDRRQKMISMLTESEESYNKVISFIARQ